MYRVLPDLIQLLLTVWIDFYWVSSVFIECERVLLVSIELTGIFLGFTGFYWVLMDLAGILLDFTGLYRVLLGFTGI